jgi:hypothetical protein
MCTASPSIAAASVGKAKNTTTAATTHAIYRVMFKNNKLSSKVTLVANS